MVKFLELYQPLTLTLTQTGKEKVKFLELYQPLTSTWAQTSKEKVKFWSFVNDLRRISRLGALGVPFPSSLLHPRMTFPKILNLGNVW